MAKPLPHTLAITPRHAVPALVLATALTVTGFSYLSAESVTEAQASRRFDRLARAAIDAVVQRLDGDLSLLRATAGLVAALGRAPTGDELHAQFTALDPLAHHPGVRGIGWVQPVRPDELAAAVVHLEPHDGANERVIAFDMSSDPARREAMAAARDTGLPAATGRLDLVQGPGAPPGAGFVVFLPAYSGPRAPTSAGERQARLLGWVFMAFAADEFLEGTLPATTVPFRIAVFDGEAPGPGAALMRSGPAPGVPSRSRLARIPAVGRIWAISLEAGPDLLTDAERQLPRVVGAVGCLVALLLFSFTWREAQARGRAERVALRNAVLADAGRLLGASFDYRNTLGDVARLAAGQVADGIAVYLAGESEPVWLVAHRGADVAEAAATALRGWRPSPDDAHGPAAALRLGSSHLARGAPSPDEPPLSRHPELLAVVRLARVRAVLTVPLVARGEPLGALVLASSLRFRAFPPETVALAEDLARLMVAAVESARLYRQAQDAVRIRDDFLSIASHELKTPITSLALQADSLRASAVRGEVEGIARKIEVIRRNIGRLSSLVAALLDLSRIQSGRLELEPEDVDLAEIVHEVAARFEEEAQRAHTPIRVEAPVPVVGRWDRLRVDQVVTNLVSNALKYGRGRPVEIAVSASDDRASLSVRDSGIGIDPADQPRIFERFERAVSERHYGGFGLGLWIAREMVQAMGGEIRVRSAHGEGATFTVELARRQVPLAAGKRELEAAGPAGRRAPGSG